MTRQRPTTPTTDDTDANGQRAASTADGSEEMENRHRETMADVSHTPPEGATGANPVFERGATGSAVDGPTGSDE